METQCLPRDPAQETLRTAFAFQDIRKSPVKIQHILRWSFTEILEEVLRRTCTDFLSRDLVEGAPYS